MLKGKVALVTGAARGIGRAICENFADCGADIAFFYASNDSAAEECKASVEARGAKCRAYKCDVSDYHAVEEAFKSVVAEFGTIDILVNNAGITRDRLVLAMKEQDFDDVIAVNLKGAFNCIRHVSRMMLRQRSGRIISLASVVGLHGNAGQANYAASKAGIIGLTKSAAKELASRGITVNAIAPGFIKTDMTDVLSDKVKENIAASIPMGKMGTTEDVAKAAAFLASDGAGYITGQVLSVDGGMAM